MSSQRIHTLRYAVRPPVVLKYWGLLAAVLGLTTLVPLAVALWTQEWTMAVRLAIVIAVLLGIGTPLARFPAPRHVQVNEALTVVVLAFVLSAGAMVWPFTAAGLTPLDAWFEAVSGITTTGLTTLATVQDRPVTFLFTRAWLQWLGGLGIVVLSVALLLRHSAASRKLAVADATGDTLVSTTRAHARRMLTVYGSLSLFGLAVLWALTGDGFVALTHTLSTVSTGGFSAFDDSLAGLGSGWAQGFTIALAWCGAVSLPLYYLTWQRGWRALGTDMELRALVVATVLLTVLLYWIADDLLQGSWLQALGLAASAQTTTGFTLLDVKDLGATAQLALVAAMFVGGSIGSSAGGIKLFRLLIFLQLLRLLVQRTGAPQHAVMEPRLAGRRLEYDELARALFLIALFGAVVLASWFVFVLHGYEPMDALFEVVSASATVGLSSGLTRTDLEPLLKVVLCIDMLAGRVEVLALLVVLYPGTWFGKQSETT